MAEYNLSLSGITKSSVWDLQEKRKESTLYRITDGNKDDTVSDARR